MRSLAFLLAPGSLGWIAGASQLVNQRGFTGYRIHDEETLGLDVFPDACKSALMDLIHCDLVTQGWTHHEYHGILNDQDNIDSVCDKGCFQSIEDWRASVNKHCEGHVWEGGAPPDVLGSFISYGITETCQAEKDTGNNCNEVILNYSDGDTVEEMPDSELCSDCFLDRLRMMQASPYSVYRQVGFYQDALQAAVQRCGLVNQPTATKDSPFPTPTPEDTLCLSGLKHTTQSGDTCDSLARKFSVSSAAIFSGNPDLMDCYDIVQGVDVCMPLPCKIYNLQSNDTFLGVQSKVNLRIRSLRRFNPWIKRDYSNLQSATQTLGRVVCISEPGGDYDFKVIAKEYGLADPEYAHEVVGPPHRAVLATDTSMRCGRWHTAAKGDTCGHVLSRHRISVSIFSLANPSISRSDCTGSLVPGRTYCVGPTVDFLDTAPRSPDY